MTKLAVTFACALALAATAAASAATPSPSPSPKPTPNPYRTLKFGTATLAAGATGNIELVDGWVAVRRDGRGWHACVSFKNHDSRTASSVLFEFPLMDRNGEVLEKLRFDRRGTFSTGVTFAAGRASKAGRAARIAATMRTATERASGWPPSRCSKRDSRPIASCGWITPTALLGRLPARRSTSCHPERRRAALNVSS